MALILILRVQFFIIIDQIDVGGVWFGLWSVLVWWLVATA